MSISKWRVVRGGSWLSVPEWVRSADRSRFTPVLRSLFLGFRVASCDREDREDKAKDTLRVVRGGAWGSDPLWLRSANRDWDFPDYRYNFLGFRLAQDAKKDQLASCGDNKPARRSQCVTRGGSWVTKPWNVHSANRSRSNPDYRNYNIGFRLAQDKEDTNLCSARVIRGGSWFAEPLNVRSASRNWYLPAFRYDDLGFRLARST